MDATGNKDNSPILTKREYEVLELLGHGFSQKEIVERLYICQKTVDKHIESIKSKYGANKNTELMGLYVAMKKRKKFDINLLRKYGLEIFFILINICPADTAHL